MFSKGPPTATAKLEKWEAMPAFYRLTFMCCWLCLPSFQSF